MSFCCKTMDDKIVDLKYYDISDHNVIYDKQWRTYTITFKRPKEREDHSTYIFYCPFCGKKLPCKLFDKWFEILEEEYGITDPQDTEYDKVPAEFRTDEWWKKRGL